jgi:pyrimidine and pyridine-specific 5'-nucleotidase
MASTANIDDTDLRPVFFFDIDNCLYPRDKGIYDAMRNLINDFIARHLSLSVDDATELHQKYYKEYGLAVEGLYRHHNIQPLDFNREVDDSLPLDDILEANPQLQSFLQKFDKTKVKLWLFTNAHRDHGMRVVRLLGIEDYFEGITYCDYTGNRLLCKPNPEMFRKAEEEAQVPFLDQCYFVGQSTTNLIFLVCAEKSR